MDQAVISPDSLYRELHNDFLYNIEVDGKTYKTNTHFIYAAMMPDREMASFIGFQLDGATVRKKANGILFGKNVKGDRKLSQAAEYIIMKALEEGYRARFTSNKWLRDKLIGTGAEPLVYTRDNYTYLPGDNTVLGLNTNNNGQNKLGLFLEVLRGNLRRTSQTPVEKIHVIDRLFFIVKRRELLLESLTKGHFPIDYSIGGLYAAKKGITDISEAFAMDYPGHIREMYWTMYQRGITDKKHVLDQDIINEFETGNTDWIEQTYDKYIMELSVLIIYLNFMKIEYKTLLWSIAKKKIMDAYWGRRFDFSTGKAVQLSMKEYLDKYKVTLATLAFVGEDALSDMRIITSRKYENGELDIIPNLEDDITKEFNIQKYLIDQQTTFYKFVPKVEDPSDQLAKLIALDMPPEPLSPRQTYGGESMEDYYPPSLPKGACSDDLSAICPLGNSDDDFDDDGGEEKKLSDFDDEDEKEFDNEKSDDEKNDNEHLFDQGDEDNPDFNGDNQNLDGVKKGPSPPRRYRMPINPIKFSKADDYPYEWLSPDYIDMFKINGEHYPSVSHYVIAKLATPIQFQNVSPRLWIQKDPTYKYGREEVEKGKAIFKVEADKLDNPKYFWSLHDCLEILQDRIKEINNQLYIRYADRVMNIKMRHYPFRQILFSTIPNTIVYYDDNNQNAVAGAQVVKILTQIRDDIKDIVKLDPLPGPDYNPKENRTLYNYIRERTIELLRASVLFSRYRMYPSREGYISEDIPSVSFSDIRYVLRYIYTTCEDVNYNEYVANPPDRYVTEFGILLTEILKKYMPGKDIYNTDNESDRDAVRLKIEGKSEDTFEDKIVVSVSELMRMVWIHITYMVNYLVSDLGDNYTEIQLQQKIKDTRRVIYLSNVGTKDLAAVKATVGIASALHLYYPAQKVMSQAEIEFINDFIFPYDMDVSPIMEAESYNKYVDLLPKITGIYGNAEQNLSIIKKVSKIIDELVNFSEVDKVLFNKLTIRVKFFASEF